MKEKLNGCKKNRGARSIVQGVEMGDGENCKERLKEILSTRVSLTERLRRKMMGKRKLLEESSCNTGARSGMQGVEMADGRGCEERQTIR